MSLRENRVIKAFINCVKTGQYTLDYATTLIEDAQRYGWLSEAAKEEFYATFEEPVIEEVDEEEVEVIPAEELIEETTE